MFVYSRILPLSRPLVVAALVTGLFTASTFVRAQTATVATKSAASNGSARSVVVAEGLSNPWALAFLPGDPDGRMLVTERAGRMRIDRKEMTVRGRGHDSAGLLDQFLAFLRNFGTLGERLKLK